MPFPAGVDTVTLTAGAAGYRALDGEPYTGTIRLTPSVSRVVSAEHGIIALGVVNITVGASGQFVEDPDVLATDADGFEPSGWTYRVDEEFTNAPGRAYSISLPAAVPEVALPSLSPVESSSGTVTPGGGGAVSSVNGETGAVVLDAADVGAAPTSRQILAGVGLTGGGTLAADRTLTVSFGTTGATVCVGNDARLSDARTPTTHAASHGSGGSDPVTVAQSQVTGLAASLAAKVTGPLPSTDNAVARYDGTTGLVIQDSGVTIADDGAMAIGGALTVTGYTTLAGGQFNSSFAAFGDMTLYGTNKGFRFRRGGDATDFEGAGTDLVVSVWSGGDFSGTQHSYLRLSSDAQNAQLEGPLEVVTALYGGAVHKLDPGTGVAALGAKDGLSNIRLTGRRATAGPPTTGTWTAGDTVQDAAGAWWLCTVGGTPGTWSGGAKPWVFDVTAYGAKGDAKVVADGAMASGSTTLTSATAAFTAADVGKAISVKGAAATGVTTLVTTIAAYVSATQVTLTAANGSGGAVSGAIVIWGTDDTTAIQAAVDAAEAYLAAGNTYAQVYCPPLPYVIAGPLNNTRSGNGQIVFGVYPATGVKRILEFASDVTGAAAVRHWQQLVPQYGGACFISLGVFASTAAQTASINADGNPAVISGPNEGFGYGASAVFSNVMPVLTNISFLTTHSSFGLTYGAANFYGCANAHITNFSTGTAGVVAVGSDYSSPGTFGTGLSVGLLLPAPGNNHHVVLDNISIQGGYTYACFFTEHAVAKRYMALYCWAGAVFVGNYFGSVGSVHAMRIESCGIEACINEVYILGVGSGGVGPIVHIEELSTESSTPNIGGQAAHMAAARGWINWAGLFTESGLTHDNPTGIVSTNGQTASEVRTVTGTLTARPIDRVLRADASGGAVTVNLPSAAPNLVEYTIIKADSSGNTVTIDPSGSQTINGDATKVLSAQWETVTLRSDGANWLAI